MLHSRCSGPFRSRRSSCRSRAHVETLEQRCLLAADVVISEIMYHQASDETGLEFIELHNAGDETAELESWHFDQGVAFEFPATSIGAHEYLVVAANVDDFAAAYPDIDNVIGGWTGRLANRGERITLVDASGSIIDTVRYADEGDWSEGRYLDEDDNGQRGWNWLTPHDGDGNSLELINPELSNDHGGNWSASVSVGGTPGRVNSVDSNDVAPVVVDLSHSPAIPTSTQDVQITFDLVDEIPTSATATLHWSVDGEPGANEVAMTRIDSTFVATIPAQADTSVVEFSVRVTDEAGNERIVPQFESDLAGRTANRLYQVLDDAASVQTWQAGDQPITYLIMTDAERNILRDIGDGPLIEALSNAQMNATFIRVDGNAEDVRYNVGIRNRGGSSRIGPPNNYRINFAHDDRFESQTRLNFNSRFTHAQIIGSAIYRAAGMAAAEGRPAQVRVNGIDLAEQQGPNMFGSYVEMEVITGSFPDQYYPDDDKGNLYRVVESGTETGDLRFEGTDPQAYQDTYSKRTNEEEDDWSDLIELVDALNNTPDAQFAEAVSRVVDVDQWLRYIALDSLLGNLETGLNVGRGDNYWLYRGTEDTRFRMIPHDLDTILGVGRVGQPNRSIFAYTATAGLSRFLTHEEFVPRYYQAFVDLMDELYNPETLFPIMDQLIGHVTETELNDMKQFVVDRIAGVKAQLPTEFVVTSELPLVDGFHRTTLPSAELVGTANALETQSVLVNGQLAEWSPFTREWNVSVAGTGTAQSLIAEGSDWRYDDSGANLNTAWRRDTFDDSGWSFGAGPLGYGESGLGTTVGFGGNPNDRNITTYFRHEFDVADASQILDLSLRLQRDDGAIVYVNDVEVARSNMPQDNIDFQTVASSWIGGGLEGQQLSFAVDPTLLQDGNNVVAVEIHQVTAIDDDLRFDLALEATVGTVTGGVGLNPGVNRILVEAFDGPDGQGELVDSGHIDVWYDGSIVQDPQQCEDATEHGVLAPAVITAGALTEDTVLAPCGPAYRVTGQIDVPEGVTLTVLPGTTVFFEAGAGIVFQGGKLDAAGTKYEPIRLTRAPELVGSWNGIQFVNSTADNRISHAILEHATTEAGLVGLTSSRLEIDNTTFDNADFFRIVTVDSSLIVRDSHFTDIFEAGEPPATDNASEHIKGSGILAGGQLLLSGNHFGRTTGHNDSVDFDGAALPNAIPVIVNNTFAGSGDDALDLEADAYIAGNAFFDVVKDQYNTSTGDANAISAGDGRTYYVSGNTFYNVDHAVQVKDEAFLYFDHNTVDTVGISPIFFDLDDRSPGRGANVTSSIFTNTPNTFGSADQAQELSVSHSIVAADAVDLGEGNFVADPRLVDPANGDFTLGPGSPAMGRAADQRDIGAAVPAVSLIGTPQASTGRTHATIQVVGSNIISYSYRLNGGVFGEFVSVDAPIQLVDLANGSYLVEISTRDVAGQTSAAYASETWVVDTTKTHLYISEVLASNDSVHQFGETPDLIELHNDSDTPIDLTGFSITDDPAQPGKFVFAEGTSIEAGGYVVLLATDDPGDGIRTGFKLAADGESVLIHNAEGELIDSVEFGIQLTDLSIGIVGHDRTWQLTEPTFGTANVAISTGAPQSLRINEWMAVADIRFDGDFLELYNLDRVPVPLGGLYLTDDPIANPTRHAIPPLSFIDAESFQVFDPNGNLANGADELPFGISADGEIVALLDANQRTIDQVFVLDQTLDRSEGRLPDGSGQIGATALATPGNPNPTFTTTNTTLLAFDDTWSYDDSGTDLGTTWREATFDDSGWQVGPGVFGNANGELPEPIGTPMATQIITHYFRTGFEVSTDLLDNGSQFELNMLVDDGVIIYINGTEFLRRGLRDGEVDFETTANRGVSTATLEGPFVIPASLLVAGENTIAAELHQLSRSSNRYDAIFGAEITSATTFTDDTSARLIALMNGLRITELMYNPASDDSDEEYIELTNVLDKPIELSGVTISGGVDALIGPVELQPGEYAILTPDVDAFRSKYGAEPRIAGTYDGKLSNGGEELILGLPSPYDSSFDGAVLRFAYDDNWYPDTDGEGRSLEIVDASAHPADWTVATGWRASLDIDGSPGSDGSTVVAQGDFNGDGSVDVVDVDILANAIVTMSEDTRFDLNQDGVVDVDDQQFLVVDLLETRAGDTNIDGFVDFPDFLALSGNFGQNDRAWSDGDFDANGVVDFSDFLLLSANFGFARPAPASAVDLAIALLLAEEDDA